MSPKKYPFNPDYTVPPGETIKEVMENMKMTKQDLAEQLDITVQDLDLIFRGEKEVSSKLSLKLENLTGVPKSFWDKLESQHRRKLHLQEEYF